MKLLYCTPQIAGAGGLERVLTTKMNYLANKGFDITIVTTDQKGQAPYFALSPRVRTIDLGLNYKDDFNNPIWKRLWLSTSKQRQHRRLLAEILAEVGPDVIISTFHEEVYILASIANGIPVVVESHLTKGNFAINNPASKYSPRWWLHRFYLVRDEQAVKKATKLVLLSHADQASWGGIADTCVIPNPLGIAPQTQATLDAPIILAVGRLTKQKNFEELITIWHPLSRKYPDWKLRIVGEGYLLDELQQMIRRLRLEQSVELLPPSRAIEGHYLQASIYTLSSLFEGFGMVLIEAMACGVPVVSYDCPTGPSEIVHDGIDGFLIPNGDRATFARRLEELIQDAGLRQRLGQGALSSSQRYRVDAIMAQWIALFEELSGSYSPQK